MQTRLTVGYAARVSHATRVWHCRQSGFVSARRFARISPRIEFFVPNATLAEFRKAMQEFNTVGRGSVVFDFQEYKRAELADEKTTQGKKAVYDPVTHFKMTVTMKNTHMSQFEFEGEANSVSKKVTVQEKSRKIAAQHKIIWSDALGKLPRLLSTIETDGLNAIYAVMGQRP